MTVKIREDLGSDLFNFFQKENNLIIKIRIIYTFILF